MPPSLQPSPPALLGGHWGIPNQAERHNLPNMESGASFQLYSHVSILVKSPNHLHWSGSSTPLSPSRMTKLLTLSLRESPYPMMSGQKLISPAVISFFCLLPTTRRHSWGYGCKIHQSPAVLFCSFTCEHNSEIFGEKLIPFPAENHGLRTGDTYLHCSCFTVGWKPLQCQPEVIARWSQQNHIICKKQRRYPEATKTNLLAESINEWQSAPLAKAITLWDQSWLCQQTNKPFTLVLESRITLPIPHLLKPLPSGHSKTCTRQSKISKFDFKWMCDRWLAQLARQTVHVSWRTGSCMCARRKFAMRVLACWNNSFLENVLLFYTGPHVLLKPSFTICEVFVKSCVTKSHFKCNIL